MNNQCRVYARKNDAKNIENHRTWNPKGMQQSINICKKTRYENDARKKAHQQMRREGQPGRAPSLDSIFFFVPLTFLKRLNIHMLRLLTPLRYTHRLESSQDVNLWATVSSADFGLVGLCVWGFGLWVCDFVFCVFGL